MSYNHTKFMTILEERENRREEDINNLNFEMHNYLITLQLYLINKKD